eukprot:TRINITY_DN2618_c0_g1_i1.p1 TRINITY_DN2618_c0_g1~~TRINITY_DN2618_c0_g1_i1.p1  ORF type:complete len:4053 (+),score=1003.02 TRINITY_DN2618_c0_g1_i1:38-12196(+)
MSGDTYTYTSHSHMSVGVSPGLGAPITGEFDAGTPVGYIEHTPARPAYLRPRTTSDEGQGAEEKKGKDNGNGKKGKRSYKMMKDKAAFAFRTSAEENMWQSIKNKISGSSEPAFKLDPELSKTKAFVVLCNFPHWKRDMKVVLDLCSRQPGSIDLKQIIDQSDPTLSCDEVAEVFGNTFYTSDLEYTKFVLSMGQTSAFIKSKRRDHSYKPPALMEYLRSTRMIWCRDTAGKEEHAMCFYILGKVFDVRHSDDYFRGMYKDISQDDFCFAAARVMHLAEYHTGLDNHASHIVLLCCPTSAHFTALLESNIVGMGQDALLTAKHQSIMKSKSADDWVEFIATVAKVKPSVQDTLAYVDAYVDTTNMGVFLPCLQAVLLCETVKGIPAKEEVVLEWFEKLMREAWPRLLGQDLHDVRDLHDNLRSNGVLECALAGLPEDILTNARCLGNLLSVFGDQCVPYLDVSGPFITYEDAFDKLTTVTQYFSGTKQAGEVAARLLRKALSCEPKDGIVHKLCPAAPNHVVHLMQGAHQELKTCKEWTEVQNYFKEAEKLKKELQAIAEAGSLTEADLAKLHGAKCVPIRDAQAYWNKQKVRIEAVEDALTGFAGSKQIQHPPRLEALGLRDLINNKRNARKGEQLKDWEPAVAGKYFDDMPALYDEYKALIKVTCFCSKMHEAASAAQKDTVHSAEDYCGWIQQYVDSMKSAARQLMCALGDDKVLVKDLEELLHNRNYEDVAKQLELLTGFVFKSGETGLVEAVTTKLVRCADVLQAAGACEVLMSSQVQLMGFVQGTLHFDDLSSLCTGDGMPGALAFATAEEYLHRATAAFPDLLKFDVDLFRSFIQLHIQGLCNLLLEQKDDQKFGRFIERMCGAEERNHKVMLAFRALREVFYEGGDSVQLQKLLTEKSFARLGEVVETVMLLQPRMQQMRMLDGKLDVVSGGLVVDTAYTVLRRAHLLLARMDFVFSITDTGVQCIAEGEPAEGQVRGAYIRDLARDVKLAHVAVKNEVGDCAEPYGIPFEEVLQHRGTVKRLQEQAQELSILYIGVWDLMVQLHENGCPGYDVSARPHRVPCAPFPTRKKKLVELQSRMDRQLVSWKHLLGGVGEVSTLLALLPQQQLVLLLKLTRLLIEHPENKDALQGVHEILLFFDSSLKKEAILPLPGLSQGEVPNEEATMRDARVAVMLVKNVVKPAHMLNCLRVSCGLRSWGAVDRLCNKETGVGLQHVLVDRKDNLWCSVVMLYLQKLGRLPHPCELMMCSPETSEVDLQHFVKRWKLSVRDGLPEFVFSLLEPRLLRPEVQHLVLQTRGAVTRAVLVWSTEKPRWCEDTEVFQLCTVSPEWEGARRTMKDSLHSHWGGSVVAVSSGHAQSGKTLTAMKGASDRLFASVLVDSVDNTGRRIARVQSQRTGRPTLLHLDVLHNAAPEVLDWLLLHYLLLRVLPYSGGVCAWHRADTDLQVIVEIPCAPKGTFTLASLLPCRNVPLAYSFDRVVLREPDALTTRLFTVHIETDTKAQRIVAVCREVMRNARTSYTMPRIVLEGLTVPQEAINGADTILQEVMAFFDDDTRAYTLFQKVRFMKYMTVILEKTMLLEFGEDLSADEDAVKQGLWRFAAVGNVAAAALEFVVRTMDTGAEHTDLARRFDIDTPSAMDSRTLLVPHERCRSFNVVSLDDETVLGTNGTYGKHDALLRRLPVPPTDAAKQAYARNKPLLLAEGRVHHEPCKGIQDLMDMLTTTSGIEELIEWVGGDPTHENVSAFSKAMEDQRTHLITAHGLYKMLQVHLMLEAGLPVYVMGESGVGKTCTMLVLTSLRCMELVVINVHGGTTPEEIRAQAAEAIAAVRRGGRRLLVLDEANASPYICMKQLLSDRMLCEERLPDGLQILCMVNPVRYKTDLMQAIDAEGMPLSAKAEQKEKVYSVYAPSESTLTHIMLWPNPCRSTISPMQAQRCIPGARTNLDVAVQRDVTDETLMIERAVHSAMGSDEFALLTKTEMTATRNGRVFEHTLLVALIARSQAYYRDMYGCDSVVSLRVISRVCKCLIWAMRLVRDLCSCRGEEVLQRGISVALVANYAVRLTPERREVYYKEIDATWARVVTEMDAHGMHLAQPTPIGKQFDDVAELLADEMRIKREEMIVKTSAFNENVLMMFMAICLSSMLLVVGMPGTSKSLALDRLVVATQNPAFLKGKYPKIMKCSMQCSRETTAGAIKDLAESAARMKLNLEQQQKSDNVILVLEEIGLAAGALLQLHTLVDHGVSVEDVGGELRKVRLCIIGLSNARLDASKMDRGFVTLRGTPSDADIVQTLKELCTGWDLELEVKEAIVGSAEAAATCFATSVLQRERPVSLRSGQRSFRRIFGMRDLFAMISFIRDNLTMRLTPAPPRIDSHLAMWAVTSNLSGFPDKQQQQTLVEAMATSWSSQDNCTMQRATWVLRNDTDVKLCDTCVKGYLNEDLHRKALRPVDCEWNLVGNLRKLFDRCEERGANCTGIHDSPSVSQLLAWGLGDTEARNTMLLSKGGQGLSLLLGMGLLRTGSYEIVFGPDGSSQFELHSVAQVEGLETVKHCMQHGKVAVLVNFRSLYESLYDLLNKRYVTDTTGTYARIGFGAQTLNCSVMRGFHLILVEDQDRLDELDPPLLNRLRKLILNCDSCLDPAQERVLQGVCDAFTVEYNGERYCLIQHFFKACGEQSLESLVLHNSGSMETVQKDVQHVVELIVDVSGPFEVLAVKHELMEVTGPHIMKLYERYSEEEHTCLGSAAEAMFVRHGDNHSIRMVALVAEAPVYWNDAAIESDELFVEQAGPVTIYSIEQFRSFKDFEKACTDFRNLENNEACMILKVSHLKDMRYRLTRMMYQVETLLDTEGTDLQRHVIILVHPTVHSTLTFFKGWTMFSVDRVTSPQDNEVFLNFSTKEWCDVLVSDSDDHFGTVKNLLLAGSPLKALCAALRYPAGYRGRTELLSVLEGGLNHDALLSRVCEEAAGISELNGTKWVSVALRSHMVGASVGATLHKFIQQVCLNVVKQLMPAVDRNANLSLMGEHGDLWSDMFGSIVPTFASRLANTWTACVADELLEVPCSYAAVFPFSETVIGQLSSNWEYTRQKDTFVQGLAPRGLGCLTNLSEKQLCCLYADWCVLLYMERKRMPCPQRCMSVCLALFRQEGIAGVSDVAHFMCTHGGLVTAALHAACVLGPTRAATCAQDENVLVSLLKHIVDALGESDHDKAKVFQLERAAQELHVQMTEQRSETVWADFIEQRAIREAFGAAPPEALLPSPSRSVGGVVAALREHHWVIATVLPFLNASLAADVSLELLEDHDGLSEASVQSLLGVLLRSTDLGTVDGEHIARAVREGRAAVLMSYVWIDMLRRTHNNIDDMVSVAEALGSATSFAGQQLYQATQRAILDRIVADIKTIYNDQLSGRPTKEKRFCSSREATKWLEDNIVVPGFHGSDLERAVAECLTVNYTQLGGISGLLASDVASILPDAVIRSPLLMRCKGINLGLVTALDSVGDESVRTLIEGFIAAAGTEAFKNECMSRMGTASDTLPSISEAELQLMCLVLATAVLDTSPWQSIVKHLDQLTGSYFVGSSDGACFETLETWCAPGRDVSTYAYTCPGGHVYTTQACANINSSGYCQFYGCGRETGGVKYGVVEEGNRQLGGAQAVLQDWRDGRFVGKYGGREPSEPGYVPYNDTAGHHTIRGLPRGVVKILHLITTTAVFWGMFLGRKRYTPATGAREQATACEVLQEVRKTLDELKELCTPDAVGNSDLLKNISNAVTALQKMDTPAAHRDPGARRVAETAMQQVIVQQQPDAADMPELLTVHCTPVPTLSGFQRYALSTEGLDESVPKLAYVLQHYKVHASAAKDLPSFLRFLVKLMHDLKGKVSKLQAEGMTLKEYICSRNAEEQDEYEKLFADFKASADSIKELVIEYNCVNFQERAIDNTVSLDRPLSFYLPATDDDGIVMQAYLGVYAARYNTLSVVSGGGGAQPADPFTLLHHITGYDLEEDVCTAAHTAGSRLGDCEVRGRGTCERAAVQVLHQLRGNKCGLRALPVHGVAADSGTV